MNLAKIYNSLSDQPSYRLKQIDQAIFKDLIFSWEEVSTLPKNLRDKLSEEANLSIKSELLESSRSNSKACIITLEDGHKIETVLMHHQDGRQTICVSSQVGCPLKCEFCATGNMGFVRNLTSSEIIEQVIFWARHLKQKKYKVTNVVYMGMGEPFLNYGNVIESIKILNAENKFGLGIRNFSISTVGVVPEINKLADSGMQVNLAISLHATNNELRSKLMPINEKYPIEMILDSALKYVGKTSRKIMFEYLLIENINDSEKDAQALADLINHKLFMINLIPLNPVKNFKSPSTSAIEKFKQVLDKNKINYTQRHAFGKDLKAACGQLANKIIKKANLVL